MANLSSLPAANGFIQSWPISNIWFLGQQESTLKMASQSVQLFLQGLQMWPTDRQTILL